MQLTVEAESTSPDQAKPWQSSRESSKSTRLGRQGCDWLIWEERFARELASCWLLPQTVEAHAMNSYDPISSNFMISCKMRGVSLEILYAREIIIDTPGHAKSVALICHVILRQPSWRAAFGERRLALVAKRAKARIFIHGSGGVKVCIATGGHRLTLEGIFWRRAWQPWYSVLPDEGEKATEDLGSQSVTESSCLDMFGLGLQQRFHSCCNTA